MYIVSSLEPSVLPIVIKYAFRSLYLALRFDTLELLLKFPRLLLLIGASLIAHVTDRLSCSDRRTVLFVEISALGHRTPVSVILENHFINIAIRTALTIDIGGRLVLLPRQVFLLSKVYRIRVELIVGNFLLFFHCKCCRWILN